MIMLKTLLIAVISLSSLGSALALPPGAAEVIIRNKERLKVQSQTEGPNKQLYVDILQYFSELETNWDANLALEPSQVPKSAQYWHKILRFYFDNNTSKYEVEKIEEFPALPMLLSITAPPDFRNLSSMDYHDYEIKGLERRSVDIRLLYIRSMLKIGFTKFISMDIARIWTMRILKFANELFSVPALQKELNSTDIEEIAVILNEFLKLDVETFTSLQKSSFAALPKELLVQQDSQNYKNFVASIRFSCRKGFTNLLKAKPELHRAIIAAKQRNTLKLYESIIQTIENQKEESVKLDLLTMVLVSFKGTPSQTGHKQNNELITSKDVLSLYDSVILEKDYKEIAAKFQTWENTVSQNEGLKNRVLIADLTKNLLEHLEILTFKLKNVAIEYNLDKEVPYDPSFDSEIKTFKDKLLEKL